MKSIIVIALVLAMSTPAWAILGQPIADEAVGKAGTMGLQASITVESDLNLYGVRAGYDITDELALFVGLGLADLDGLDTELFLQAGGKLTLPVDLPVDLALRGALGFASFGKGGLDLDVLTLSAGLLASKQLDPRLIAYGFGGLSMSRTKASLRGFGSRSDSETDPAIAAGVIVPIDTTISLFGEIAHIDELFISIGGRLLF